MPPSPRHTRLRGKIERELRAAGRSFAGVDEVGRGCLAGPVVAGAAVLDMNRVAKLPAAQRRLLRDSKLLTAEQRQSMLPVIQSISISTKVAWASVPEIERIGIAPACFLAIRRAIDLLEADFDLLLVDGKHPVPGYEGEQRAIIKGDNLCYSIAAAAILAKETRDSYMRQQAELHPHYGFDAHVGYGTRQHLSMIRKHGICALHRRNFDPIRTIAQLNHPTAEPAALLG